MTEEDFKGMTVCGASLYTADLYASFAILLAQTGERNLALFWKAASDGIKLRLQELDTELCSVVIT